MEIIRFRLEELPTPRKDLSLALGNFDGVHRGHQSLFVATSLNAKGDAGALLFANPFGLGPHLSSIEDKIRFSLSSRLDVLYVLENDPSFFDLEPEAFIDLLKRFGATRVVVGPDFRFGKNAKGTPETLRSCFEVEEVPMLELEGEKISSRQIKSLLEEGDLKQANERLGRSYEIRGTVKEGFHDGAKLGFPTANIAPSFDYVLPKIGVYCAAVYVDGVAYRAMVNVGVNPTLGKLDKPVIEAHILDYDGDCYGKTIYCAFLAYLRPEKKFDSLEQLKEQLQKDERLVRDLFA